MIRPARQAVEAGLGPLPILFALSGAAGLVHEIAWTRALGQSLGHSLQALTTVLGAFLLGLALGAAASSRFARRAASPVALYGLIEAALGLYAFGSPAIAAAVTGVLERVGPRVAEGAPLSCLRLGLGLLALLPPASLMGATFPLLVRAGARGGASPGSAVSILYGLNTLGAAAGAGLGSFLLLPLLGTRHTFAAAGTVNLAVGLIAIAIGDRRNTESAPPALRTGPRHGAILAASALSGVTGALFQIGWTRVASLAFGSTLYALGMTLTAQILGLGCGPLVAQRFLGRRGGAAGITDPAFLAGVAQGAAGLLALALLPLFGALPILAAQLSGRFGDRPFWAYGAQFVIMIVLLLGPTLAQGASFPALTLLAGTGRSIEAASGEVYGASSAGTMLGFLLAGFVALPALGTQRTLAWAAAGSCFIGAALLLGARRGRAGEDRSAARPLPIRSAAAALVLIGPLLTVSIPRWEPSLMAGGGFLYGPLYRAALGPSRLQEGMRRRGTLLFDEDGAEGRVTVRRSPGGILSLQINGRTEASTGADMSTQLLAAHLPLFLHEGGAPRTLLIGLASGVSLGAIESHPVATIRVIEIVPGVVRAAAWFAESNHAALRDPRVRITLDDARAALLARSERYDLIISQPSNPWVSGVANLFTVEFYRLAKRRLAPGGMLGQWIQAYRLAPSDLAGVVGAFLEVFPDATLWEESPGGGDYFLIGGDHPLRVDPSRWLEPGYAAAWSDLQRIGISAPAQILGRFAAGPEALRAFAGGARPQTDDDLYLEWRAPLALFKDTLRDQLAALDRHRESPLTILAGGEQARPPGLIASLHGMEQARQSRLAMLSGLRDADLWSLRDPFLDSGIEALRGSRFVEAAATLTRAATANPKSGTAQLLLAEAYRAAGLPGAAEVAYRAAIERDPDLPAAWNGLGSCLAGRGRTDEARLAFLRALQIDPALAPARNNLGALLLSTGDDVGAESALRSALAIDPALMAARVNLGLIMKRRGDLRGAVESDRAALALDPLNGDARFNLAVALAASGRPDEAHRELLTLLRSDPADPQAARALREIETSGRIRGSEKERARRPAPAPTPP